jgi:hypothetical protein
VAKNFSVFRDSTIQSVLVEGCTGGGVTTVLRRETISRSFTSETLADKVTLVIIAGYFHS